MQMAGEDAPLVTEFPFMAALMAERGPSVKLGSARSQLAKPLEPPRFARPSLRGYIGVLSRFIEVGRMAKAKGKSKRSSSSGRWTVRDSAHGTFLGLIDEHDAHKFERANTAYKKAATTSKAKAIKALKASGYLTKSGAIAKRYR